MKDLLKHTHNERDRLVAKATIQTVEDLLDRKVEGQLDRNLPTDIAAFVGSKLNQQVKIDTYRALKKELSDLRKMI